MRRPATLMLDVLYEDNHLLAVNKPAMLPTMGVPADTPARKSSRRADGNGPRQSLLALAKQYVGHKYAKPGNVYLGVVSRLDAPVTGVVLLARTSKAAARLSQQFRDRHVEKTYWALVDGNVSPSSSRLVNFLRKDERHRRVHVTGPHALGAQQAELTYRTIGGRADDEYMPTVPATTLLEVDLLTGRKHQIRVQLAHLGYPIVGDRKYGSDRTFSVGIALHARRLVVEHPVRHTPLTIEAPLPAAWQRWLNSDC